MKETVVKCHTCTRILGVVFGVAFKRPVYCELCAEGPRYAALEKKGRR